MDLSRVAERLKALANEVAALPPNQRLILGLSVLVGLIGLVLIAARLLAGPPYVPVYTDLTAQDAAAIANYLDQQKIPYQLSSDGTTISVPQSDAAKVRLGVASQGLPKGGTVGFEIFDQSQLGMTDFQQQVEYTQALEGELDRTIEQMQQVEQARVLLVLPKPSVFATESQPAQAAVFLKLRPLATLTPSEVRGITYLVARSVQGLSPSRVTVVNDQGQILSDRSPASGGLAGNLATEAAFDQNLSAQLEQLLAPVVGPGNVVVHVAADLNFDAGTVVRHLYTQPARGGLVTSIQRLTQTFRGQGAPPLPAAGTSGNIPSYVTQIAGSGPSTYTETSVKETRAVDETTVMTHIVPGSTRRLSVAVVVNRVLTPAQRAALLATVRAAIGYDPARHDQISVVGLPFSNSLAATAQQALNQQLALERVRTLVPIGIAAVASVAALLMLRAALRARRAQPEPVLAAEAPVAPAQAPEPDEEAELRRLAEERPGDLAAIVRAWLNEE